MSKKHFIALADAIRAIVPQVERREDKSFEAGYIAGVQAQHHIVVSALVRFCAEQNHNFNQERWLDYIAGKCGPNGGAIRD